MSEVVLTEIGKHFSGTTVLRDVSLTIRSGEVLSLLGDNGAGKSTLIKILSGVESQSHGSIAIDGEDVAFAYPGDAVEFGISTVHQYGGTFPLMSIGRNFFIGNEPRKKGWPIPIIDIKHANEVAVHELRSLGITRIHDGDRLVGSLSGGERQALAIARAVYFGARVLILDEPTAALGVKQSAYVLKAILDARGRGVTVVFVTHNVTHALEVSDHFAILNNGTVVADFKKDEKGRDEVMGLMAGGDPIVDIRSEARLPAT